MMEIRDKYILEEINGVEKVIQDEEVKEEEEREKLRPLYKEWVEDYCNMTFDDYEVPAAISLALDELVKADPKSFNIASEKLDNLTISYGGRSADGGLD